MNPLFNSRGSNSSEFGAFNQLAKEADIYYNGEGVLSPGGFRQIPTDPSFATALAPAAKLYCPLMVDSLEYWDQSGVATQLWGEIGEVVGHLPDSVEEDGCFEVTCPHHWVPSPAVKKATCASCKVAQ